MAKTRAVHQVDEGLPFGKLIVLGLQHVLVMYAVAVPLILGSVMKLSKEALTPFLHSGILLAAISAVVLNAYFNGTGSEEEARRQATATGHSSEARMPLRAHEYLAGKRY